MRLALLILTALVLTLGAARPAGAQAHILADGRVVNTALAGDIAIGDAHHVAHVRLVRGGTVDGSVYVAGRSTLRAEGGHITGALSCAEEAAAVVSGTTFGGALEAVGDSTIDLRGGASGDSVSAYGHSTVTVSGGEIGGDLNAYERGTVNLRGGSVRNSIDAEQRGTVNIWGTGLHVTHNLGAGTGEFNLSGRLADGTLLDGTPLSISNDAGVRIIFHNIVSGHATVLRTHGSAGASQISFTWLALMCVLAAMLAGLVVAGVRRTGRPQREDRPGRP